MTLKFFINFGFFLLAINTILFLIGFKKNATPFKILCLYSVFMAVVQAISSILASNGIHNIYMSHFYFWLQFFTLSAFFYSLLKQENIKKYIKITTLVIATLGVASYVYRPEQFFEFNLIEILITSFPLIIYALLHMFFLLSEKKRYYYFVVGLIIYLFGSTIVFLAGNLMISTDHRLSSIWILNIFLYIVYQALISYELKTSFFKKTTI